MNLVHHKILYLYSADSCCVVSVETISEIKLTQEGTCFIHPLCTISVDGLLARGVDLTLQRFADKLAFKKVGQVICRNYGMDENKTIFAILRAMNYCVRGSRVKWRSGVGMEDGAGLNLMW